MARPQQYCESSDLSTSFNSYSARSGASPSLHHYYVQSPSRISSASTHLDDKSSAPSSPLTRLSSSRLASKIEPSGPLLNYKWTSLSEEPVLPISQANHLQIRRQYLFWCWVTFISALFIFLISSLVVWLVRRPFPPDMVLQGIKFNKISITQGSDQVDVPTQVITLDSRIDISVHNPSKYFRMVYTPSIFTLLYLGVPIARGEVYEFSQHKKSENVLPIDLRSLFVPLYGAGPSLQASISSRSVVILALTGSVESHVDLLGSFIRCRFYKSVNCNVLLDLGTLKVLTATCSIPTSL